MQRDDGPLYAIGDIQGCGRALDALLARLPAHARLIFVGDLVNRGPQSLYCLRKVRDLCLAGRAVAVLGNHDLHLLAVAADIRPHHADDTFGDILNAPDAAALIDWLRTCPLAHFEAGALFVHAGALPPWTRAQALVLAAEVEAGLRASDYKKFLATMYGNEPARWSDALVGADRHRCVINAMTRMRLLDAAGTMNFRIKGPPADAPAGLVPWFDHPERATRDTPVVFGHWSAVGFMNRPDAVCLDTGCVWGRALTAFSWPQREVVQVGCAENQTQG